MNRQTEKSMRKDRDNKKADKLNEYTDRKR